MHPNNHVPHFTTNCFGPLFVQRGHGRYQPKDARNVAKFQGMCTHQGMFCLLSGLHATGMTNAKLARLYHPDCVGLGLHSYHC